jgi:vibriolysin
VQPSAPGVGPASPTPAGPNNLRVGADWLAPDARSALERFSSFEVVAKGASGLPSFVRGSLGHVARTGTGLQHDDVEPALAPIAAIYRLKADELITTKAKVDSLGQTHVHLQQSHHGLKVVGGDLRLHIDQAGTIFAVNGTAQGELEELPSEPRLDAAAAMPIALDFAGGGGLVAESSELSYVLGSLTDKLHLAWEISVRGTNAKNQPLHDRVYVDAIDGNVVSNVALIHSAMNRTLYSADGTATPRKRLLFGEAGPTDYSNPPANDNHWWLGHIAEFYFSVFGRDSWNGEGASLDSTVDYVNGDPNNAYATGDGLLFGPGDGVNFGNFASSGDVITHEFTHAMIGSEAALGGNSESGGMNESLADIFMAVRDDWAKGGYDADTWLLGEDIVTPNGPSDDALRYLNEPTRDGYSADHYSTRLYRDGCLPTQDNDQCGSHGNAGISNLALYLSVAGGTRHGVTVSPVGMAKARWIFYRAAIHYLTSFSNLAAFRAATVQAALDLYGSPTSAQIAQAWDAVGVGSRPVNDDVANATTIAALPTSLYGSLRFATADPFFYDLFLEPKDQEPSVWYKWTAPRSGFVSIWVPCPGLSFVPEVRLGTGSTARQNLVGIAQGSALWAAVVSGNTYRIRVTDSASDPPCDTFQLNMQEETAGLVAHLSDLPWKSATNGWGSVERDMSNGESGARDGRTLTLNGTTYSKGLGVHAGSDVRYDLAKKYARFVASIGVDDEVGAAGSVVFQVYADNVKIYDSGVMTGSTATKNVDLNVANKSELRLVVTDNGNGNGSDHADWANARVVPSDVADVQAPAAPPWLNVVTHFTDSQRAVSGAYLNWERSSDGSFGTSYQLMSGSTHFGSVMEDGDAQPGDRYFFELNGLTPGTRYDLTVRAVDAAGNISAPSGVITLNTDPVAPAVSGLLGRYYSSTRFDGAPKLSRADATVNFNWGTASPGAGVPADQFSARWTGYVTPAYSQTYTFYARTDDGARLWVDDRLVIDKWINQASTEWSGSVALQANRPYSIRLEMYDNSGGAVSQLSWSSASQPKQIIPANRLSHRN